MSVPRLVVCGLEPGPAVALAAGALLGSLAEHAAVRPVTIGLDVSLWRLLYGVGERAPRVLDPLLFDDAAAGELYDSWAAGCDLLALVAVEPALDRWHGVKGSRAVDVSVVLDAPLVVVVDARERGATVAAAVCGLRSLTRDLEFAGVIVVGGDESAAAAGLRELIEERAGMPVLGWLPPRLSEQFAGRYAGGRSAGRVGPELVKGGELALCKEAGTYLRHAEILAAASRGGFVPARLRRLLAPLPEAAGLTLGVAWGPPLEPFALESMDLLQAMGVQLAPFHIGRDRDLPAGVDGLLLAGLLDEDELASFAANEDLKAALVDAVSGGLPTLALGGGTLLLLRRLADSRGRSHELAGILPAEAELLEWYERPRYVRAEAARENPYDEGESLLYELFDLEFLTLQQEAFAYRVGEPGGPGQSEGFVCGRCLASTLVPSLPARPGLAASFVSAMRAASADT